MGSAVWPIEEGWVGCEGDNGWGPLAVQPKTMRSESSVMTASTRLILLRYASWASASYLENKK